MNIDSDALIGELRGMVPRRATDKRVYPLRVWMRDQNAYHTNVVPPPERMASAIRAALAVQGVGLYRRGASFIVRTAEGDAEAGFTAVSETIRNAFLLATPLLTDLTDGRGIDVSDRFDTVDRLLFAAEHDTDRMNRYLREVLIELRRRSKRPPKLATPKPSVPKPPKERRDYQKLYQLRRDETTAYLIEAWLDEDSPYGRYTTADVWASMQGTLEELLSEHQSFWDRKRRGLFEPESTWAAYVADNPGDGLPELEPVAITPRQLSAAIWDRCRDQSDSRFRKIKSNGVNYLEVRP